MRALVLSGGGSKGAFQVGVLKKWMLEDGIDYDLVAGVSVGAINAASLCQYPKGSPDSAWRNLEQMWLGLSTSKVRKSWCLVGMLASVWKTSAYDSRPLQKLIRENLDVAKVRESGRALRVVSVSWNTGESRVVDETSEDLSSWVIASSAFPGLLTPADIEGQIWADGGLRQLTPLGEAIRAGATDIDVILTADPDLANPYKGKRRVLPDMAMRAIELMSNALMRADLKICGLKNDLAGPYRTVNLRVAMPGVDLETIQGSLDFEPEGTRKMMELGYSTAVSMG